MELNTYATITLEDVEGLARTLAHRDLPVIKRFEPVTDFEELVTFTTENTTPVEYADRNPIWRLESVSARLIEAVAIAAHEPMLDIGWQVLARIILEHAEYLYTYHYSHHAHERLLAGGALALISSLCRALPQAAAWRLAGFARIAESIDKVEGVSAQSHLIDPIDGAFELALSLNLPILGDAINRYDTALHRDLQWDKRTRFKLSDQDFFDQLDLSYPGLEGVKSEWERGHLEETKSAYVKRKRSFVDFRQSADFRQPMLCSYFDMAKSYLEQALHLSAYQPLDYIDFQEDTGRIGIAALLFPEWRNQEQFLKLALRRYKWINNKCIFPDGFQTECSSTSHQSSFTCLSSFYQLARRCDFRLPQDFHEQFEKMIEGFMYLSQPDYRMPLLGDCSLTDVHAREPCRVGHALFNREDFLYMASEGSAGTPPDETSHAFPYAGYYVMRDNWGVDAQYLAFDSGVFGSENAHEDKLNFVLYAYGRPLIIDPGGTQANDAFGDYLRSSRGHNSVMVDGKGQCRALMCDAEIIPDPDTRWLTTPSFDFVEGWYKEGYAKKGFADPDLNMHHKRSIFYVKGSARKQGMVNGEYFILHDLILGEGEHLLEQIFHLAPVLDVPGRELNFAAKHSDEPGRVEVMEHKVVRTVEPSLSNLVIVPVDAADLEVRLQCGEADPIVGWTALQHKTTSYDLTYTVKRSLPTVMNTVLLPLRPRAEMVPEVKPVEVVTDPDVLATGFTVAHSRFIDLILISDDGFAEMSTTEVEFAGEYLFLRLDEEGQPQRIAMINGQFVKLGECVLVDLPQPQENYES